MGWGPLDFADDWRGKEDVSAANILLQITLASLNDLSAPTRRRPPKETLAFSCRLVQQASTGCFSTKHWFENRPENSEYENRHERTIIAHPSAGQLQDLPCLDLFGFLILRGTCFLEWGNRLQ